jgi:hypothetical protein
MSALMLVLMPDYRLTCSISKISSPLTNFTTQSRMICTVTPPIRAASVRDAPSYRCKRATAVPTAHSSIAEPPVLPSIRQSRCEAEWAWQTPNVCLFELSQTADRNTSESALPRSGIRTKAKLKAATESHMIKLAANPDRVKAFFNDPRCKYAA